MPHSPPVHSTSGSKQQQAKVYDAGRRHEPAKRLRSSARWQAYTVWFKRRHPLCADPFGTHKDDGRVVPADHVHHIKPLRDYPALAFVESNCASLCAACHSKVEAKVLDDKAKKAYS